MNDLQTSDRDVSRAIRSWLHEDRHEDASRIAGAVLDQVEATPRRRTPWWPARRTPEMNKFLTIGLGTAAVVVVVLVGAQLIGSPGGGVGTDSSPTPKASVESTLLSDTECVDLDAGTYHAVIGTLTVGMTVPAGWSWSSYAPAGDQTFAARASACVMGSSRNLEFWLVDRVYPDACRRDSPVETDTPAAVAAALAAQRGHETAGPSDDTLGGYPASRFELSFLAGVDSGPCAGAPAALWSPGQEIFGDSLTVYVVDIGGTALAVVAIEPDAEMNAIVASLRIEP